MEVSAQEAVYLVLQMPLSRDTRDLVFINTSKPNERIQLLKAKHDLDELTESSTDIVADNVIKLVGVSLTTNYDKAADCAGQDQTAGSVV